MLETENIFVFQPVAVGNTKSYQSRSSLKAVVNSAHSIKL